jgi:hypothetical protein
MCHLQRLKEFNIVLEKITKKLLQHSNSVQSEP